MKKLIQTLLLLLILFTISCGNKIYKTHINENTFLIEIEKSGCYGTCPVYKISLDNKGNVIYEGKKFTAMKGIHKWKMKQKDFRYVKSIITKKMCVNALENINAIDLPKTTLTILGVYQIKYKGTIPKRWDTEINEVFNLIFNQSNTN